MRPPRSTPLKLTRVLVDTNDERFVEFLLCNPWRFESAPSSSFTASVKRADVLISLNLLF